MKPASEVALELVRHDDRLRVQLAAALDRVAVLTGERDRYQAAFGFTLAERDALEVQLAEARADYDRVVAELVAETDLLAEARAALLTTVDNLTDTRWAPTSPLSAWPHTLDGRNHVRVMAALGTARAVLAKLGGAQ